MKKAYFTHTYRDWTFTDIVTDNGVTTITKMKDNWYSANINSVTEYAETAQKAYLAVRRATR